ncbi:hypothetical protein AMATHDRAFT_40648 [Amanita thiersii Skay4041]|uniref:Uncharacterized protein n=1 Tax=Amanita thiersii Skay4041 TaxID=703135 RepID=A0A2A9NN35_9AGAR|nr:hypothetical protein AMATHDRAFT_40648 [Amanita thiersii Skay4041]
MFSPQLPPHYPLHTPLQPFFPHPPRPTHHPAQASIAQFPPIHPPFTPLSPHYARNSISLIPGQSPFPPPLLQQPTRHRKQVSIGGPPKAVLGGPQRKLSPLPPSLNPAASAMQKLKKVVVNLPRETIPAEEQGQQAIRPEWARTPVANVQEYEEPLVPPVDTTSREIYPPDVWRRHIPDTIDVFLPGQHAWDALKQMVIEEKLEQLGVERGSGSNVPHIFAPHARAASISSPADPALLLFKLNKLQQQQQQQDGVVSPLVNASPHPPFNASPRFLSVPPQATINTNNSNNGTSASGIIRHGHTMSLAQPSYHPSTLDPVPPPDQIPVNIYHTALSPAPRPSISIPPSIRAPIAPAISSPQNGLAPPALSAVHPRSRSDFIRGFGLETPEEVDEEEEHEAQNELLVAAVETDSGAADGTVTAGDDLEAEEEVLRSVDAVTATGPHSRIHSRHQSKLSAALSGVGHEGDVTEDLDTDAVGEWTGSEDLYPSTSDNESIGEWSNPSDEERARQERAERRMRRRAVRQQLIDKPRRIPNFPKPPENPVSVPMINHHHRLSNPQPAQPHTDTPSRDEDYDDIISNPSEEACLQQDQEYLAVAAGNYYAQISPNPRPLPPLPHHSRAPSTGQHSIYDPAQAHSRTSSDTFGVHYQQQLQQQQQQQAVSQSPNQPALNPFAKPFVFGGGRQAQFIQVQQPQPQSRTLSVPPNAPLLSHSPLPSFGSSSAGARASISSIASLTGKPLNVAAPEFKPGGFNFRPPPGMPQMPSLQAPQSSSLLGLGTVSTENNRAVPAAISPGLFSRPLPAIPTSSSQVGTGEHEVREYQGREKRQRRNSSSGDLSNTGVIEEGDSIRSFRFPMNMESPNSLRSMRRSMSDASVRHRVMSSGDKSDKERLSVGAEPFTFANFQAVAALPYVPTHENPLEEEGEKDMEVEEEEEEGNLNESTFADDSTAKNEPRGGGELFESNEAEVDKGGDDEDETMSLFRTKKRPPLPLDFKGNVTRKNTVPAGLFKALVNGNRDGSSGDDWAKRTVRSGLGSRDIFDHESVRKPSMDDTNVPLISNKFTRGRFVTDPGRRELFSQRRSSGDEGDDENDDEAYEIEKAVLVQEDEEDVFSVSRQQQRHARRRSSLPDDLHDVEDQDERVLVSSPGVELTTRAEMQDFEERLNGLLEDKFADMTRALREGHAEAGEESAPVLNSRTEAMIADMVSLFRAQLQENAARSLEDSQMDARGEMDFQLIKDIIDEGHKELAGMLRREIKESADGRQHTQQIHDVVARVVEDVGSRTVSAIVETIADFSSRQEAAVNRVASTPVRDRDAIAEKLVNALTPMITSLRADPIDYEFLTSQLAQAVKPHISQLIDLASDKRETAGLIVDKILPLLPERVAPQPVDVDALSLKLTTEVRRAIAPIDAHEIKEQVADLVIERLNSRLAVRDKAFNVDAITAKLVASISDLVQEPVGKVMDALDKVVEEQKTSTSSQVDELATKITELPSKLSDRLDGLVTAQEKIAARLDVVSRDDVKDSVRALKSTIGQLIDGNKALQNRDEELMSLNKEILDKVLSLPNALLAASHVLSDTHSELVGSLDSSRREVDELRKLNTEYQVQVAKARGAHGQVRVEKDALNEKLAAAEAERERLRAQVKEMQTATTAQATEITALKQKNSELEASSTEALTRLRDADVASKATQQRLTDMEQTNQKLLSEKQVLESKVETLNVQVNSAVHDKESVTQALEALRKQNEDLALHQTHWESLRQASDKIDALTNLIGQADNEELKELRAYRDRAKTLEGEHATLQKRFKDLELKVSNSERAATTARQSLAQAQQRASEWERRAKESEAQLELTRTKFEQSEQTQTQMDADLSLIKLQLEEHEANDRLAEDRETKLREQIATLESKVVRLQTELEHSKTPKLSQAVPIAAPSPFNSNGISSARPDSRASTVYNVRLGTPSQRAMPASQASSTGSGTPPGSVWDSIHAPKQPYPTPSWSSYQQKRYPHLGPSTPKGRSNTSHYYRPTVPSPTPSTVSLTPTQGEDGWWS